MKVKPMFSSIFVLPDKIVDKTDSGIILSDYTKKRPTSGTVLAVGPKVKEIKVGDRIIYGEFSGAKEIMEYGSQDTEIFLMTEDDVIALLEDAK